MLVQMLSSFETILIKLWEWFVRYIFIKKVAQRFPAITNIPNKQLFFWCSRLNLSICICWLGQKCRVWHITYDITHVTWIWLTWTYKLCIRYLCFIKSWFNSQTLCIVLLCVNQFIVPIPNIPLYHRWT